jgi:predicted small secreted protein
MRDTRGARGGRIRRWGVTAVVLAALASLTACNTIAGAGRDVEALGRAVSDSAERARW